MFYNKQTSAAASSSSPGFFSRIGSRIVGVFKAGAKVAAIATPTFIVGSSFLESAKKNVAENGLDTFDKKMDAAVDFAKVGITAATGFSVYNNGITGGLKTAFKWSALTTVASVGSHFVEGIVNEAHATSPAVVTDIEELRTRRDDNLAQELQVASQASQGGLSFGG